jgi:Uma2 family endonuclease
VFPDKTDLTLANPKEPISIATLKRPIVPDLFIICNNNFELVGNNIVAIPDFICEIVSPSSIKMDNNAKKELYISKGVREYWIVDYFYKTIKVCFNGEEKEFSFEDDVKVNIFNDLNICLKDMKLFE